jgi:AcrR family transcriptional regulator
MASGLGGLSARHRVVESKANGHLMASTYPTTPKGHRTRSQILAAAAEVFARDGYVHTGMNDIADRAGLSMGGLYRYFGSKEELFAILAQEHLEQFLLTLGEAWDELATRPESGVIAINRAMVGFWVRRAGLSRVLEEAAAVAPQHLDAVEANRSKAIAGIGRRLVVAGRVPEGRSLTRLIELLIDTTRRAARQVVDDPALDEDTTVDLLVELWSAALFGSGPGAAE